MATYISGQGALAEILGRGLLTSDEYEGLLEVFFKYGPFIFEGSPSYNIDILTSKSIREGKPNWIQIDMEALRNS